MTLNFELFFDDLSFALYSRPEALEAALTSGAQEHWLATEASILLSSDRKKYGIDGLHEENPSCIPKWWVAREAGRVDLFVAPEEISENESFYAFEFKVIRSESYKCVTILDDLWYQISGERKLHRNYRWENDRVNWYGIVLAFDAHYAAGFSRTKRTKAKFGSNEMNNDFFSRIWGKGSYENWTVLRGWEVWSSRNSNFPQYLDKEKESSVKMFLIQGKVRDGMEKKPMPHPAEVAIKSAACIRSR